MPVNVMVAPPAYETEGLFDVGVVVLTINCDFVASLLYA
jgi:hypothetical protein